MKLGDPSEYLAVLPEIVEAGSVSADSLLRLRRQLEIGLPLTPRPYQKLAEMSGLSEQDVMTAIRQWRAQGLIKRFGLVVRHRTLGYAANAMVVWDVPDDQVQDLGRVMASTHFITLCYQRPRRGPGWPYNLFCMIHGIDRRRVMAQLESLINDNGLQHTPHAVLFSTKAYRQRGGRYVSCN